MAEMEQTKVCPLCAETIKAKAKVCPYCRKLQSRYAFMSAQDAQMIGAFMLFLGAVFLIFCFFGSSRQFSPNQHKIDILNAQYGIETTKDETNAVAFGVLTNANAYSWRDLKFEIRFLDANGKTIETTKGNDYGGTPLSPHSESSFHFKLDQMSTLPPFASSKIRVTEAEDVSLWSKD